MNMQSQPVADNTSRVELLTRKQAADYLGVKDITLAIWKSTGRYNLPSYKIGRLVKYKRSDLDAFISSRRQA